MSAKRSPQVVGSREPRNDGFPAGKPSVVHIYRRAKTKFVAHGSARYAGRCRVHVIGFGEQTTPDEMARLQWTLQERVTGPLVVEIVHWETSPQVLVETRDFLVSCGHVVEVVAGRGHLQHPWAVPR